MRTPLRHPSSIMAPVVTAGLYFVMAVLALVSSRFEGGLAFIWSANALLMADLMTSRSSYWWRPILACGVASVVATWFFGMGPTAALPMAIVNLSEALIVAAICRRFAPDLRIAGSLRSLAVFIIALCGPGNIIPGMGAAFIASNVTGIFFGTGWLQWYTGHVLGGLTCTPILMVLLQGELTRWTRHAAVRMQAEALGLLAFFALITTHVFFLAHYPMLFVPLLPLVVIAFRIGHLGSAAAVVILAFIGGYATLTGHGPLHMISVTMGQRIQFLQLYLAFSFLLSVPVAAELDRRRHLLRMLQASEARYRLIADHSGDVVLNIGVGGVIEYASPSALEQIGFSPDELVGQPVADLSDPEDRALVIAAHRQAIERPGDVQTVEFRPRISLDGRDCYEMVTRAALDEQGQPIGAISTIRDMSHHKAQQRALLKVAAIDSLTGADTRRAFLEKLDSELRRAALGVKSCLLLIDIDHFKTVNDCHGHGAGDQVLAGFVERLRPGLRSMDSIGRLGGEEFAILLSGVDIRRASVVCERLRTMVARSPLWVDSRGQGISVTFSAGLVELKQKADRTDVLEAADKALYRAKHSGRNCLRLAA